MFASEGILTSRGGKTSHAAVVARGMGKCCVAGAEGIHVDVEKRIVIVGDTTERMFNDPARLPIVIDMIADSKEERQEAVDRLLPLQQKGFKALFEVMSPYPVVIRPLDPPIREFLPNEDMWVKLGWYARSPNSSNSPPTPTASPPWAPP